MSNVIDILNNDKTVLKDNYPKVLYFTASWCAPCQRIGPVYLELSKYNTNIKFFKIDVDKNEELATLFKIESMPTFIFLKSKTEYRYFTGADSVKLNIHIKWMNDV